MKLLILFLLLISAAGCGGGGNPAASVPAGADLRADVMVKNISGAIDVEVMYYFSSPEAAGVKTSNPKEFIEVAEPTVNDSPMALTKNAAGQPVYKPEAAKWTTENTLTANLGGKPFIGKTAPDKLPGNKMTTITLVPKQ